MLGRAQLPKMKKIIPYIRKWPNMEFSKKLLIFSWTVTLALTTITVWMSRAALPTDAMSYIVPLAWAETATSTAFYYWKAKNENRAKYAQTFLKDIGNEWGTDTALRIAEIVLKD